MKLSNPGFSCATGQCQIATGHLLGRPAVKREAQRALKRSVALKPPYALKKNGNHKAQIPPFLPQYTRGDPTDTANNESTNKSASTLKPHPHPFRGEHPRHPRYRSWGDTLTPTHSLTHTQTHTHTHTTDTQRSILANLQEIALGNKENQSDEWMAPHLNLFRSICHCRL